MKAPSSRTQPRKENRRSAVERGYTAQWARYSRMVREENPHCIQCETLEVTELVDHIIPVSGPNDPLFWEEWNHQPLCRRCHAHKTNHHDGRLMQNRQQILKQCDGTRNGTLKAAGLTCCDDTAGDGQAVWSDSDHGGR